MNNKIKLVGIQNAPPLNISDCLRCGTCCQKGGPALHKEDKQILHAGHIGLTCLITFRKGELAFSPLSGTLEPLQKELVKITGTGKKWTCCFYDMKKSACTIYSHRPSECRLLKCWDTEKLLSVIGEDTLARADILDKSDPMMKLIEEHERDCSIQMAEDLISALVQKNDEERSIAKLTALVQKDLAIRSKAIAEFGLSLEAELFVFGRPLFKLLVARGFQFMESETN